MTQDKLEGDRFPDIEIYVKNPGPDAIEAWLEKFFSITDSSARGLSTRFKLTYSSTPLECLVVNDAARGGFVSIWFKNNVTPWPSDEACARDAFAFFGNEVRCSTGSWAEEEKAGWLSITDRGERTVAWED